MRDPSFIDAMGKRPTPAIAAQPLVAACGGVAYAVAAVMRRRTFVATAALLPSWAPAQMMAEPVHATLMAELDGPTLLARATEAAGGDSWTQVRTLVLHGRAIFWGPSGAAPRSSAEHYSMWRVFDPARAASHGAEGKVRIVARNGDKLMFTVAYDGSTTWTEKGITPAAEADAFWANNFGFGIIRQAMEPAPGRSTASATTPPAPPPSGRPAEASMKPGFKADRIADGWSHGHPVHLVRVTDPKGGVSLFGIDPVSYAVRSIGFVTPRGWHERHYDEFVRQDNPAWLQSREVTLYYNGVKANTVFWQRWAINAPIDDAVFAPPAVFPPPALVTQAR